MWKGSLILLLSVLSLNSVSAQRNHRIISGSVRDVYNGPIANAIIMIDDHKTNAVTDLKGNYKVKVKSGSSKIGIFTFGNGTIEEKIDGRSRIDFNFSTMAKDQLDPLLRQGETGIDNGYGSIKRKNLTTEVTNIDGQDIKYSTYSSIYDMIQRHVSGVQVYGKNVIIQGSRDFQGFETPLVVVDGVYMNSVPNIPPSTVKSIQVLKSTAAAIYGSRAKGGAIIINTKLQAD